jgi:cytochrome c-type biogenesis protein CcmH
MIFAWMVLLAVLSASFVVFPLLGKARDQVIVADSTSAVLVDQLEEVQRDLDRNVISEGEATAAQLEIKRRILTVARRAAQGPDADNRGGRNGLFLAAVFVPLFAGGYYALMGSPEISSLSFADRQAERVEQQKIVDLTDKLYARLVSEPGGGASEGWMLLGQTFSRMGEYQRAVEAFEIVANRDDATSATYSMLAEALINAEQGIVTPKAETAINVAMELDAANPAGVFYKSVALAQRGEEAAAHALLLSHLAAAEGFASWMEPFVQQANHIAEKLGRDPITLTDYAPIAGSEPGPSAEDIAAAGDMSDENRGEFILSMVDRLASRLEEDPNDLDGWIRLANAYRVLGNNKQALSAYERATVLLETIGSADQRHEIVRKALTELQNQSVEE